MKALMLLFAFASLASAQTVYDRTGSSAPAALQFACPIDMVYYQAVGGCYEPVTNTLWPLGGPPPAATVRENERVKRENWVKHLGCIKADRHTGETYLKCMEPAFKLYQLKQALEAAEYRLAIAKMEAAAARKALAEASKATK